VRPVRVYAGWIGGPIEDAGMTANTRAATDRAGPAHGARRRAILRHSATIRATHWINVWCVTVLLMSGLQIFNAYPRLHWGQYGADADRAFIALEAQRTDAGLRGVARIGDWTFPTTGILGVSERAGHVEVRGFPAWATIPSYRDLSAGRRWHFFFAWLFVLNGLAYLIHGIASGHFRRDLVPDRDQRRLRHILRDVADHLRLRFPKGAEARRYNVLQKSAYLAVVFVVLPLMVLTGLTMSPGIDAACPFLVDVFGGRQSARTIHFLSAMLIVLFVVIHLAMVMLTGPWNNLRSMITGRYAIDDEDAR
jgi:thiosulfate reductase cytochrome b subunit